MKRALVFSGGGNRFYYASGLLYCLLNSGYYYKFINRYNYIAGTSAGALLSLFVNSIKYNNFNNILNLKPSDFYSFYPFKDVNLYYNYKSKSYTTTYKFKILKSLYRILLMGKNTLGDTSNLINLIKSIFTFDIYKDILIRSNLDILVTATNFDSGDLVIKRMCDLISVNGDRTNKFLEADLYQSYNEFIDYVYASTCAAPIMSTHKIGNDVYVDGGFVENIPIKPVLLNYPDVDVIDVIVINSNEVDNKNKDKSLLDIISGLFDIMLYNMGMDDITMSQYIAEIKKLTLNKDVKINVIYFNDKTFKNVSPFLFDYNVIKLLYESGYLKSYLKINDLLSALELKSDDIQSINQSRMSLKNNDKSLNFNFFEIN